MSFITSLVVMLILGVILGYILNELISRIRSEGTIRVDMSDPYDGPYMFLEISDSIENVGDKDYVTLKVEVSDYISQN